MEYKLATSSWDNKEIDAIQKVIDSNIFSMAEQVKIYENHFSSFFGSKYAVMTSSGSTANLLMVAALFFRKNNFLKRGDEVIVPAVSWSTTYFPLQQYGLKLKFVDIDIKTLNYNLDQLEKAVTERTKLIMTVNLLGNSNNFDSINLIASKNDIIVIEDNCESMGAKFNDLYTGTFGIMGTFSSFFSHHIATMEGGVVLTDDKELFHILLSLRAHGWTRNLPKDNLVCEKSDDSFKESFRFVLPGYNVRPLEMSGAIGIEQLKKLPDFITTRRKNAQLFIDLFSDDKNFIIQEEIGDSSWFGFSLIINNEKIQRKDLLEYLRNANIETRPIVTGDFTQNEVMKYFDYEIYGDLKNANFLHNNGFFVGNSHVDLEEEINYLRQTINRFLSEEV